MEGRVADQYSGDVYRLKTRNRRDGAGSPDLTAYRSLRRKLFIESCERSRIKRSR